ncbi:hypothetical protein G6F24_016421 [Rhizopus arrhizus]|nr:hypothetical protein G6F24_016421 [Rhizopus arrhizus]
MGYRLQNTAYSVNIKERLDFSCAIFDAQARLIANAPHMPVHLGAMGESVRTVMNANAGRMMPGDAYVVNDPYHGGTHLPDVTVITPVFDHDGRQILFYVDGGRRRRAVHQLPVGEERRIPRTGRPRHPGLGPLAGAQSGSEHR